MLSHARSCTCDLCMDHACVHALGMMDVCSLITNSVTMGLLNCVQASEDARRQEEVCERFWCLVDGVSECAG